MINLEIPKKFKPLVSQANQVATEVFRPISRKYDEAEHAYPKELDMLASLIDGMNEGSDLGGAGAAGVRRSANGSDAGENRNGSNLSTVLGIIELCWGDVGLLLSMPRQGLGNSAISAPSRGCRSAPRACSCSAATASSRSTQSSAGTATFEQRA